MINNILIVEDEVIIGMALAAELEDHGYNIVDIACSGKEALKAVRSFQPDLIILDIKISGCMDGLETLSELRKIANPFVIVISGNSDTSTHSRIKGMAVDGFLVKPVNTKDLLGQIDAIK